MALLGRSWWVGMLLGALVGCASLPAHISAELEAPHQTATDPYAARTPDSAPASVHRGAARSWAPPAESTLKSGQLLVWGKRDAAALFVGLFAQEFRPWSHIGIVSVEPDGVYVFETNSAFLSTSDAPPTESATGGMRHLRFKDHISDDYIFGVYNPPPSVDAEEMVAFARHQFQRGARFDAFFDNQDHEALYCSEMIALALQAGGAPPARLAAVRNNRSYAVLRQWLQIRATGFYLPADFTAPEQRVAVWHRELSPAQIEALFAAQAELALRFGSDTSLGQLMQWNAFTTSMFNALSLREMPQRFIDTAVANWAHDTSPAPDTQAIQHQVKQLASQFFLLPPPALAAQR